MISGLSFTDLALHRSYPADNDTLMMKALGYRQQPKSRFEHILHTYMMMTISQNFLRKKKDFDKSNQNWPMPFGENPDYGKDFQLKDLTWLMLVLLREPLLLFLRWQPLHSQPS